MVDQHRYISVPAIVPASLFCIGLFFGVAQSFIGDEPAWRVLLATLCMATLILLSRKLGIVKEKLSSKLFPQKFAWMTLVLDYLLIKNPHDKA